MQPFGAVDRRYPPGEPKINLKSHNYTIPSEVRAFDSTCIVYAGA